MCFNKKLVSRRCTGRAIKRLSRKEMRMEKIAGYMKPDGEVIHDLQNRVLELSERCHVLDMFIENSQDAIQISDRNLITLRVNRAYEVLTGIKREELIGVPVDTGQKAADLGILRRAGGKNKEAADHRPDLFPDGTQRSRLLLACV